MERKEIAALVAWHETPGMGQKGLWRLKEHFGSMTAAAGAGREQLLASGLKPELADAWLARRPSAAEQLRRWEELTAAGVGICCMTDDEYPALLKNIFDPPFIFYYYGNIAAVHLPCVAIVGSRTATPYGSKQAGIFGRELAAAGFTVVSGMARGIDTCAHRGALEAGGKTAAILGSGLNFIYPLENRKLSEEIARDGVVLSDFAMDSAPEPWHFPHRNQIISGLSLGTLIVEAALKSGALITADAALEQGRDVFALPGPVSSRYSEGCHKLIRQGATLVSAPEDILEEYRQSPLFPAAEVPKPRRQAAEAPRPRRQTAEPGLEAAVWTALGVEPKHMDALMAALGCELGELSAALIALELKGLVSGLPGNHYVRS